MSPLNSIFFIISDGGGAEAIYEFKVSKIEETITQHRIAIEELFSGSYAGYPEIKDDALLLDIKNQMARVKSLRRYSSGKRTIIEFANVR